MIAPYKPRRFADDAVVRALGNGLLTCSLSRDAWTHEAHLAVCVWLLRERPDIVPERDLPAIIRAFNESVGGVNDDRQGYHETITQLYIAGVRAHLTERASDESLVTSVNALILGPRGKREWPLCFYSRDLLFSVEARRGFVAPDLMSLP